MQHEKHFFAELYWKYLFPSFELSRGLSQIFVFYSTWCISSNQTTKKQKMNASVKILSNFPI